MRAVLLLPLFIVQTSCLALPRALPRTGRRDVRPRFKRSPSPPRASHTILRAIDPSVWEEMEEFFRTWQPSDDDALLEQAVVAFDFRPTQVENREESNVRIGKSAQTQMICQYRSLMSSIIVKRRYDGTMEELTISCLVLMTAKQELGIELLSKPFSFSTMRDLIRDNNSWSKRDLIRDIKTTGPRLIQESGLDAKLRGQRPRESIWRRFRKGRQQRKFARRTKGIRARLTDKDVLDFAMLLIKKTEY